MCLGCWSADRELPACWLVPTTRIARVNKRGDREVEGARVNSIKGPDKLPAEGLSRVNYVVEARIDVPIVYASSGECFGRSNLGSPSARVALKMLAQQVMSGGAKQAATTGAGKRTATGYSSWPGTTEARVRGGEGREGGKSDQGSRVPKQPEDLGLETQRSRPLGMWREDKSE